MGYYTLAVYRHQPFGECLQRPTAPQLECTSHVFLQLLIPAGHARHPHRQVQLVSQSIDIQVETEVAKRKTVS
jgi:hypothetical protein